MATLQQGLVEAAAALDAALTTTALATASAIATHGADQLSDDAIAALLMSNMVSALTDAVDEARAQLSETDRMAIDAMVSEMSILTH
jgi:O-methyltransferase involved in polyketide biosynthesis